MKVGIVGLGLIGGSFAKAYHAAGWEVLAADIDRQMLDFAMLQGAVNGELTEDAQADCDLILIAVYPRAAVEYLQKHGAKIGKKPVVIDCCGTKRVVCEACFPLAEQYGFTYLGGHPMAGTHNSGFKYATATMYHGAPMVLVPADHNNIELLSRVKELLSPLRTLLGHDGGEARRNDRLHLADGARRLERLHQKPHGGQPQGLFRREL